MENIGLYAAYYIQSVLKGGLNSMNNYPIGAMPCTNARRWTRTTELK